ncbi:MAG: hypothetical protein ACLPSH_21260, partial [Vulcanimicrobiaceae bacterium]
MSQRGFSIIELLVAVIAITLIGFAGLGVVKSLAAALNGGYASPHGASVIDIQTETMRGDAATAFAVFVPTTDVFGNPATVKGVTHEVDFYSKTDDGMDVLWAYCYDPVKQTLQRYDYDSSGNVGKRDPTTGIVDPKASYSPIGDIRTFSAQTIRADQMAAAPNPYAPVLASLLPGTPQALPVSFNNFSNGYDRPDLYGGNTLVQVTLGNKATTRTLHLLSGSMPTGFTITGYPSYHVVIYKTESTHRFLGGLAGKTRDWVNARVSVSYDGTTHQQWCDFNIYGAPGGLDIGDPHQDYQPREWSESAQYVMSRCLASPGPSPLP